MAALRQMKLKLGLSKKQAAVVGIGCFGNQSYGEDREE